MSGPTHVPIQTATNLYEHVRQFNHGCERFGRVVS